MRSHHHLRTETLLGYAAGRLPAALSLVAASHLAWCPECRKAVEAAARSEDDSRHEVLHREVTVNPSRPGQTALKARERPLAAAELGATEVADFGLPMPLARHLGGKGLEDLAWRRILPGVAVRELELPPGAGQARLLRMASGKALPEHRHGDGELSLVLRGAYRDEHGRYSIGDIADLDGAAVHRPVAEYKGPCICLVATETPARCRSWLARLWQRLAGL